MDPGGDACGSVVYRCVNKKNDEKGYFFFELGSAQRCHHLGYEKCYFVGKGYVFFTSLLKRCDKGCLVVTELRKKSSIFPMYTVSVQYTKVAEV